MSFDISFNVLPSALKKVASLSASKNNCSVFILLHIIFVEPTLLIFTWFLFIVTSPKYRLHPELPEIPFPERSIRIVGCLENSVSPFKFTTNHDVFSILSVVFES